MLKRGWPVVALLAVAAIAGALVRPCGRNAAPSEASSTASRADGSDPAVAGSAGKQDLAPSESRASEALGRMVLTGRVLDSNDAPIPAASVELRLDGLDAGAEGLQQWTSGDGRFEFGVARGASDGFEIRVKAPTFAAEAWGFEIARDLDAGGAAPRRDLGDFELSRAAVVRGRLVDRRGRPPEYAYRVHCHLQQGFGRDAGRTLWPVSTLTKPFDGEFRLENVPPGVCLFEIFDSHGNSVHVETVLVETLDVHGLTIALDVPGQGDLAASLHGRREWTARAPFVNVTSSDGRVTRACSTSEEHLEFRDAGPGPYRVRVEDVAFRPTVFENLTPVEGRVSLENAVVGPCALKLDVRDASGAPILTSYRVTVCRVTVEESANRERDADESTAVDSTFLLDNLPAEPLSLEVDCGHMYEVKAVRIDSLTPGETSTLEVRMEPNRLRDSWGTLVGVVADPRNAGSNKRIDIDIAYVPEKGEREAYEKPRCRHFRLERFPDAGKVTLRWLDPNECALVVGCGDSRKATSRVLTVGNGEEVNFGTLTLPEGPRVRGRVILPEGARRWTAALVCDARLDCPLVKGCDRHGMASIANLGPDGAFAFKDLGPGVYKAYYQPSRNRTLARSPGVMGPSIFVGSFEVKGSDLENVVLDAREGWMGQLDLQLRADGRPLTAALVRIHRSGDDRYEEYAGSDVDGRMLLDPMPLGDFELDIQDRANGWVYRVPGRWAVSTEARTHVLDIPAVECRITALTAVGAPLRNTRLWLFGGFGRDAMTNITERTTDSEGILTIRLPKAPGTLSLSTSEDMFDATFESAPPATLTAKFGYQAK